MVSFDRGCAHPSSNYIATYLHNLFYQGYYQAACQHHVNQASIGLKVLEAIEIPVPPLNEQKRIVEKLEQLLSELDKAVDALKTAQEKLRTYRRAVLKAAVEGELSRAWREENKERLEQTWDESYVEPQTAEELPRLPKGWRYVHLGAVIDEPKYGTSKKCHADANGVAVLRIPNVASGTIDTSDLKFAEFDEREIASYKLEAGDLLTIRSNGSISIVGTCAVVTRQEEKYLYAGYLIRLRPIKQKARPVYLHSVLSSPLLRIQIESKAKSTSGVNNINSGELQSLVVPICRGCLRNPPTYV